MRVFLCCSRLVLMPCSMILKWMFPGGKSLPHVVVSHNARFDPVGYQSVWWDPAYADSTTT